MSAPMPDPTLPPADELEPWARMGLEFLANNGPDTVGEIDTEEKLAGAWVWSILAQRRLIRHEMGPNGPVAHITAAGLAAIGQSGRVDGGRGNG